METRAGGVPSKVVIVRSGDSGEKYGGGSLETCVDREVFKKESQMINSPQLDGVAELALQQA